MMNNKKFIFVLVYHFIILAVAATCRPIITASDANKWETIYTNSIRSTPLARDMGLAYNYY